MWDDFGPAPIDSDDLYTMGLRPARCSGCELAKWQHKLGNKFLMLNNAIYELDAEPEPGQGEPTSHEGHPISWRFWGMAFGHSDECYNWQPPQEE